MLGAKRKDSGLISFHLESGEGNQKEQTVQIRVSQKVFSVFKNSDSFNKKESKLFLFEIISTICPITRANQKMSVFFRYFPDFPN